MRDSFEKPDSESTTNVAFPVGSTTTLKPAHVRYHSDGWSAIPQSSPLNPRGDRPSSSRSARLKYSSIYREKPRPVIVSPELVVLELFSSGQQVVDSVCSSTLRESRMSLGLLCKTVSGKNFFKIVLYLFLGQL